MIDTRIRNARVALDQITKATELLKSNNSLRMKDSRYIAGEEVPCREAILLRNAVERMLAILTAEKDRRDGAVHSADGSKFVRVALRCGQNAGEFYALLPTDDIAVPHFSAEVFSSLKRVLRATNDADVVCESAHDVAVTEGTKIVHTIRGS